MELDGVAKVLS